MPRKKMGRPGCGALARPGLVGCQTICEPHAKPPPDAVQAILAEAFAAVRDDLEIQVSTSGNLNAAEEEYAGLSSTFAAACRAADEKKRRKSPDGRLVRLRALMADDVSLERAWADSKLSGRAAESTVEALMFSLREGVGALSHPDALRRLSELSDTQFRDVAVRLQKFKLAIAPTWTPEEVRVLIAARRKCHAR
jgi:hypothetical protein